MLLGSFFLFSVLFAPTRCCKPIDCRVSKWSSWSPCSRSCNGGHLWRTRKIIERDQNGGKSCNELPSGLKQVGVCFNDKCPVNCRWGTWKTWSHCSSCGDGTQYRYRNVNRPAQYNGLKCDGSMVERSDTRCTRRKVCLADYGYRRCNGSSRCRNGICIEKYLACNGDNDCGDNSDERDCNNVQHPCSSDSFSAIPGIRMTGAGYNLLSDSEGQIVLDNGKYKGTCSRFYIHKNSTTYRTPYNVQSYLPKVKASHTLAVTGYSSAKRFRSSEVKVLKNSFSFGGSYSFGKLVSVSGKVAFSKSKETLKAITASEDDSFSYFVIQNQIQVGTFRLRSNNLIKSQVFLEDVHQIPLSYDYLAYVKLFEKYGTHYVSGGKLGGKLKYTFKFANSALRNTKTSIKEQKDCLGADLSLHIYGSSNSAHIGTSNSRCSKNTHSNFNAGEFIKFAAEITSKVTGGTSPTAAGLSFTSGGNGPTAKKYQDWADKVEQNPSVISAEYSPITKLIEPAGKRRHAEKALLEYLERFDPANCKSSCDNGGELIVTNEGKECHCLCDIPYYGKSCSLKYV